MYVYKKYVCRKNFSFVCFDKDSDGDMSGDKGSDKYSDDDEDSDEDRVYGDALQKFSPPPLSSGVRHG